MGVPYFIILAVAAYYARDPKLRKQSANRTGGNPKLVSVVMDEGPQDKDLAQAEVAEALRHQETALVKLGELYRDQQ